ncbi:MAG: PilZ domain-containing protein [Desulfobulbaceae bacterium]|nr:PilZ domain-containing protein [Desulfobulbaceae bacterium]
MTKPNALLQERRKNSRLSLGLKGRLILPGDVALKGQTKNLSFGGTFFELDQVPLLTIGDYISLELLARIKFTCEIIHYNENGIGLRFDLILIRYYEHFKEMMLLHAPDRDQMIKELGRLAD